MKKTFFIKLTAIIFCAFFFILPVYADKQYDIDACISDILFLKKKSNESISNGYLVNSNMMSRIFDSQDAKFIISMSQYGIEDNIDLYGRTLLSFLQDRYSSSQKLNDLKTASGAQIALALLACDYNPLYIEDKSGNIYNFLADTIYERDSAFSLGKDGTEAYVWGLIALDAYDYGINDNIWKIRDGLISGIIQNQEADGTFITTTNLSPYYLTALTLTAISPYYQNDERKEAERQKRIEERTEKDKKRLAEGKKATFEEFEKQYELEQEPTLYDMLDVCVEKCIDVLSNAQDKNGSYTDSGIDNVKVTSAVITALCTMGIDLTTDERFIKNNNNLMDGLLKLKKNNGSFVSDKSSDIISDTTDAFSALVAYSRFLNKKTPLYDFSENETSKKQSMLGVSDYDTTNILSIGNNLDLDDYPYLYMLRNKLESQNTPKSNYLVSFIDYLLKRLSDQQKTINYINSRGNEIIYSVKGINLSKQRELNALIELCDSVPINNRDRIVIYNDLVEVSKRLDTSITVDTFMLAISFVVLISLVLVILLIFIKKNALRKLTMESIHTFHRYSIKKSENMKIKDLKLPFEDNEGFFDYETQTEYPHEEQNNKKLPFENEDNFFEYSPDDAIEAEDEGSFSLPFENDESFFVYNYDNPEKKED